MFANPLVRLGIGIPAAVLITFGLFQFMNWAISGDYEEPDDIREFTLEAITPQVEEQQVQRRARSKPRRTNTADQPPPPPKFSANKSDIDLPTPTIQGAAPTEVPTTRLNTLAIDPIAISDRDAQPIRPPVPTYPSRAAERGIEGSCDVKFDVDTRGKPYNVEAECTDRVFQREAIRAVSRVEFAPKIVRGKAAERRNVVYPLEFKLDG
ncbi:MAG: TonB family protein [Pseudomonadota bacterium]